MSNSSITFWSKLFVALSVIMGGLVAYSERERLVSFLSETKSPAATETDHAHDEAAASGVVDHLVLSEQARKNLGLKTLAVKPQDFWRTIIVPGQVDQIPGQSERRIHARLQGTILKIHVLAGQTVRPGDPLFDVQVSSELLASAQANLLRLVQEIDLNNAEIDRLKAPTEAGAVPQKALLEKQYEGRRLESARMVQLQELMVRGLSNAQVETILKTKSLLRWFTVTVPIAPTSNDHSVLPGVETPTTIDSPKIQQTAAEPEADKTAETVYVVEKMNVFPGKLVQPGDELCDLAAHGSLQIRGEAFESESAAIYRALTEQWAVTALFDLGESQPWEVGELKILYASSVIDPTNRTFEFYLPLRNEVLREATGPQQQRFRSWRYKPGQKVRLLVPVEQWKQRFVLPAEAVVSEGPDSYIFKVNGKQLERQAVGIEYRNNRQVILANDGSLFAGDVIAMNNAYQLNLAIKKASGSGTDPHAGHVH